MVEPFKVDHSLLQSLQDGSRQFDMRRWDITDERLYRLAWLNDPVTAQARPAEVETVSFVDKETGDVLTLEYKGMVFTPWAAGWVFILLGRPVGGP